MDVRMPDGTIITNVPEGTSQAQLRALLEARNRKPQDAGILGVLGMGARNTADMLGAAVDTITGDYEGVENRAVVPQYSTLESENFRRELEAAPETDSVLTELGNVAKAAWREPEGAFDEVLMQAPNSAVVLGGGAAGAAAGAMLGSAVPGIGTAIGALVGGIGGMFLGNAGIETGAKAKQAGRDGFTPEERAQAIKEGTIKGGVITGVDTATLGLSRWLGGAPGRAAGTAVTKYLSDKGVDVASNAAVRRALITNPNLVTEAMTAGADAAARVSRVPGLAATAITEPLGEGTGEYFGELLASGEGSVREAVLEAALSMPQSVVEVAGARASNPNVDAATRKQLEKLGLRQKDIDRALERADKPQSGIAALPAPGPRLPAPPAGPAGLPAPEGGIAGLPAPKRTQGLPAPTGQGAQDDMFYGMGAAPAVPSAVPDRSRISNLSRAEELAKVRSQMAAEEAAQKQAAAQAPMSPIEEEIELNRMQEAEDRVRNAGIEARSRSEQETLDNRREGNRQRQTQQRRTAIMQDVVAKNQNPDYKAVAKDYGKALQAAGMTQIVATPDEIASIRRAVNAQFATPQEPAPVEQMDRTDTPEQNAAMEAAVAPKQRAPEGMTQPSFPDMGRAKRPQPANQPEPETVVRPRVIDDAFLNALAIGKDNPVRERLRGLDLTNPEQLQQFKTIANEYAANKRNPKKAREAIPGAVMGLGANEQMEMYGPRGGINPEAKVKEPKRARQQPVEPAEPVPTGAGVSDTGQGSGQPPAAAESPADTTGATVPDTAGLGDTVPSPVPAEDGAGRRDDTLVRNPYRVEEVEDGNWAFGRDDEDGVFTATAEGFASEEEAQAEAETQAAREGTPVVKKPKQAPEPTEQQMAESERKLVEAAAGDTKTPTPEKTTAPEKPAKKSVAKSKTKEAKVPTPKESTKATTTTKADNTLKKDVVVPAWMQDEQPDVRDTKWFDMVGKLPYAYMYDGVPKIKLTKAQSEYTDSLLYGDKLTDAEAPPMIQTVQAYLKHYLSFPMALATALYEVQHNVPEYTKAAEIDRNLKDRGPMDEANYEAQKEVYDRTGGKYAEEFVRFAENMGDGVKPFIDAILAHEARSLEKKNNLTRPPSERYQITSNMYRLMKANERLETGKKPTALDKVLDELNEAKKVASAGTRGKTITALDAEGKPIPALNDDGTPKLDKDGKPIYRQRVVDTAPNPEKAQRIKMLQAKVREIVNNEDKKKLSKDEKSALKEVIESLRALPIMTSALDALNIEMHPDVVQRLKDGNLRQALIALELTAATDKAYKIAGTNFHALKSTARKFANMIGDTKVEVVEQLIDPETGRAAIGLFDPKTNTITISAQYANNPQVLLHEVAHALTVQALSNKSLPATKKLQRIYNRAKGAMSTHYGTNDLKEFVAEFYANPTFQAELKRVLDPENKERTLWQAIVDVINRYLFGVQYEKLAEYTDSLLAPAPAFMNHNAVPLGDTTLSTMNDRIGQWHKDMGRPSIDQLGAWAKDIIQNDAGVAAKRVATAFLPSQALSDVAKWYDKAVGDSIYKIHDLMLLQEGALGETQQGLDAVTNKLRDFAKKNPEQMQLFDKFTHQASFLEWHPEPSKRWAEYKGRMNDKYKRQPDDRAAFDELKKEWRQFTPEMRDMYWELINTYGDIYDKMEATLGGKLESFDPSEGKKLKNKLAKELFDKERVFPYVPFYRSGDYWLQFETNDSAEPQIMAFESGYDREMFIKRLEADKRTKVDTIVRLPQLGELTANKGWQNAPNQSFVAEVLKIMDVNKAPREEQEQVLRLFIQMLPETSFAKSLQRREGKIGFKEDSLAAFRGKAYDMARQVVQVEYSTRLYAEADKLTKRLDELRRTDPNHKIFTGNMSRVLENEVSERVKFAVNPPNNVTARMARAANRFAFLGTIGFNVSSAVVNLSQLPMVVLPYLSGTTDWKTATKAMNKAMRLHYGAGRKYLAKGYGSNTNQREIESYGHSIGNWYQMDDKGRMVLREDKEMSTQQRKDLKEIEPLIQFMHDRGVLNRSLFYDTAGVETSGKQKNVFDYVAAGSAFFFHNTERFNRETSMLAAYFNERERQKSGKLRKEEKGMSEAELKNFAMEQAIYIGHQTNGGAVLNTAPRIAQTGIGRVAMMYKTYGVTMYYNQFKLLREAYFSKLPKELRKEAERQFWNTQLAVLAISGISGLTIVGMIEAMLDLTGDDDDLPGAVKVQDAVGPAAYKGLINLATQAFGGEGIDVSSRIGLSHLLLQTNRYDFDPSLEKDIIKMLGGPFYGYTSQVIRGANDVMSGEVQRGVENMLPAAFRNMAKSVRYGSEGALTRRHDPIVGDLSLPLLTGQFFGFAPAEYVRNQERNMALKGIDRAINEKRTKLLREYYLAVRVADPDTLMEVREDIMAFNKKNPQYPIDPDSIVRSMKQHRETSRNMYNGVLFSPRNRRMLEELGDEYW